MTVGEALRTLSRATAREIEHGIADSLTIAEYDRLMIVLIRHGTQSQKADRVIRILIEKDK